MKDPIVGSKVKYGNQRQQRFFNPDMPERVNVKNLIEVDKLVASEA